jgi:hypothetical protein
MKLREEKTKNDYLLCIYFKNKFVSKMKLSQYTKVVIENTFNLAQTNENELYIIKDKILPGMIYRILGLVMLCTCYEINENQEPIIYFFILLEGKIKNAIYSKNINPTNLLLINNNENKINYKKIFEIYDVKINKSLC